MYRTHTGPGGKSTDPYDERGPRHDGAKNRDGFRPCQHEHRKKCVMRMRSDKVDDSGKKGEHGSRKRMATMIAEKKNASLRQERCCHALPASTAGSKPAP